MSGIDNLVRCLFPKPLGHSYYFRPFWPFSGGCFFIIFGRSGHFQELEPAFLLFSAILAEAAFLFFSAVFGHFQDPAFFIVFSPFGPFQEAAFL